jgi:hypothetical protein
LQDVEEPSVMDRVDVDHVASRNCGQDLAMRADVDQG